MPVSFTKLRDGSWGLRVEGQTVKAGDTVTVRKKDGSTDIKVIGKVLWTGEGVSLCSIAEETLASGKQRNRGLSRYPRTGCSCGSRDGITQDTDCFTCRHDAE